MDKPAIKVKGKKNKKLKLKQDIDEIPEQEIAQKTDEDIGAETKKSPTVKIKIKVKKDPKKRITQNIALDIADKEYNTKLRENEEKEREILENNEDLNNNLYPNLNDPAFSVKIAKKLEFSETKYKGDIADVQAMA